MVDCVLYFEGESTRTVTVCLRAAKNRFGSTNEIGVFEMRRPRPARGAESLCELLLAGRPLGTSGHLRRLRDGGHAVLCLPRCRRSYVENDTTMCRAARADGYDYNRAVHAAGRAGKARRPAVRRRRTST